MEKSLKIPKKRAVSLDKRKARAGYFFVWLRDNKDPEFLRKFNRSTLEVVPWSFDGAIKHVLGEQYNIDELWKEYQLAMGDIKEGEA